MRAKMAQAKKGPVCEGLSLGFEEIAQVPAISKVKKIINTKV